MPKPKHASSYSLTPEAKGLLERLALHLGVAKNAVLELALRQMARRELPKNNPEKSEKSP
jgi:hypothetical protein